MKTHPSAFALLVNSLVILPCFPLVQAWSPSHRVSNLHSRQHRLIPSKRIMRVGTSLADANDEQPAVNNDTNKPIPPIAFRDSTSYILAGELPPESSTPSSSSSSPPPPLRQSPSSPNPLLDPPRQIPNPYGWIRDDSRTNPQVLAHLQAENTYGQQITHHLQSLREELYHEMKSHMKETDYTTPVAKGNFWYYFKMQEGVSYPVYCRAPRNTNNVDDVDDDVGEELFHPPVNQDWIVPDPNNSGKLSPLLTGEQVYLDVPAIAEGKSYLSTGAISISPNQEYVAYTLDLTGGETCQLNVKRISTGEEWALYDVNGINVDQNIGGKKSEEKQVEEEESSATVESDADEKEAVIPLLECDGSVVWNDQNTAVFFVSMDATHRPYRVYRRQVFDKDGVYIPLEKQKDELLFEELDELFNTRIAKTFDGEYLIVRSSSKEASEVHYLKLRSDNGDDSIDGENQLTCLAKRRPKVLYRVTHSKGYWLVQTNYGGTPNLRLMACKVGEEENGENWKDVVMRSYDGGATLPVFDGGDERSLDGVTVFAPDLNTSEGDERGDQPLAFGVATGREEGLPRIWILEFDVDESNQNNDKNYSSLIVSKSTRLEFDESACDVGLGPNRDPSLPYVVVSYDSLVTPPSNIAIPLSNPSDLSVRRVLKQKEVPRYDKDAFACERTFVKSRDGKTDIPVSLVYSRETLEKRQEGEPIPTHLYGYGSYGASIEASFRATRLPLLERGMVYVLAHVRGGGENGRPWYEGAKYLSKRNTFDDFVDVARWLTGESLGDSESDTLATPSIGKGITSPDKLSCEGRSAGGLLIGASMNQAPEQFKVAILGVPFVDVACTMVDATIPLTVAEWEEWGNPNEEKYHDYIMSYCPMNNVKYGAKYPACLLTGGLYDPRVQYWEPVKFAAELRHGTSKDSGPVVLKLDLEAGHFSASDRYKYLKELAFDYAFLLDQLGLVD